MGRKRTLGSAALACLCAWFPAGADVVLDGSLGVSGQVPFVDTGTGRDYQITDDLGRFSSNGANLFHSFSLFSIPVDDAATFSSLASPQRVIARVTGGELSRIDGMLRSTIAGADLFLLNPSGISFGQEAELDVPGSFHASSADVLRFESGPDFDATDPSPDPLLSAAAPVAFGFTRAGPGPIGVSRSRDLGVAPGETFSLVGGDVTMISTSGVGENILAPGARVQIASAAGEVDIPVEGLEDLDPRALEPGTLGQIVIQAGSLIDVSTPSGGDTPAGEVLIRGERFVLTGGSRVVAKHGAAVDATGGIDVAAAGAIEIGNGARVISWSSADGRAGDVSLVGESVSVSGGANVNTFATAAGQGGDVRLDAGSVSLVDGGRILSLGLGGGRAGDLEVAAGSLAIAGANTGIESNPSGSGPGGAVEVWAGSVSLSGGGQINSLAEGSGPGGGIEIHAGDVAVTGGSQIASLNEGTDSGGALKILDAGAITVSDGAQIVSRNQSPGPGGVIELVTGSLEVSDAGRVQSETSAGGAGGDIDITAGSVLVSNRANNPEPTFISTNTLSTESGAGDGGALAIEAETVELVGGGQVFARTEGAGRAGALSVVAADRVLISGVDDQLRPSGITSRALEFATPLEGGQLSIDTRVLEVGGGGQISSATFGLGRAGDLVIEAADSVTIEGGDSVASIVSAASIANATNPIEVGQGGDLEIRTGVLELKGGGQVTTSTSGTGDAGALTVRANRVEVSGAADPTGFIASGIFSRSNTEGVPGAGDGGDLTIEAAQGVAVSEGGQISVATTGGGDAGRLEIAVGDTLELSSGGQISALSGDPGEGGDSGSVLIDAGRSVRLGGGSEITAESRGTSDGGSIIVGAMDSVALADGSTITARNTGTGKAGGITINAGQSLTSTSSSISTDARRPGDSGGEIRIQAADRIALSEGARVDTSIIVREGDLVRFSVADFPPPASGEIDIDLPAGRIEIRGTGPDSELALSGGSEISASFLNEEGAEVRVVGEGDFDALLRVGGDVEISGLREVDLSGDSKIAVEAANRGRLVAVTDDPRGATVTLVGGSIAVAGGERVTLSDGATITADSTGTGGRIAIQAEEMLYLLDSVVKTNVSLPGSLGEGGDIIIDPRFVVMNRSHIRANAQSGEGGHILISSDVFLKSGDSTVDASAEEGPGIDGEVEISAPETDLSGELATLPGAFLDVAALQTDRCAARTARAGSFVVARRGAMPAPPDVLLSPGDVDGLGAVAAPPLEEEACPPWEETR